MPQFMRLQRATDEAAEGGPLVFTASTPGTKRDGLDTATLPWRVDNYRSNPVVTWVHDFAGNRLPIGRAEVEVTGGKRAGAKAEPEGIRAAITFDPDDAFAQEIERKYRTGFLHAVSVSWDDVDDDGTPIRASGGDAVAHDLLEIAAVPVPGDPDALLERQAVALRSLARDITDALDSVEGEPEGEAEPAEAETPEPVADDTDNEPAEDGEGLERDVAAEMVAVFAQGTDDPDADRHRTYRALLPAYRRLGWTAPEFVERDELDALDAETWRALFLHDEPDLIRAGKVLSARNKADLTEAMRLIRSVLNSAGGVDEEDEGEDSGRSLSAAELDTTQDASESESDLDAFARLFAELTQEMPSNG